MKSTIMIMTIALLAAPNSEAEVMPTPDKSVNRSLPDDYDFAKDTEFQKKYHELIRNEETARSALRDASGGPVGGSTTTVSPKAQDLPREEGASAASTPLPNMLDPAGVLPRTLPKRTKVAADRLNPPVAAVNGQALSYSSGPATGTLVYAVSKEAALDETTTVLPAGSFVKARVVSGVEANTLEPYPVLLQLEYAFTGPNKTKVDLSNCFMIAKARANLSTERVIMETDTLSCVRENGEHFKASARGYTAGEDSTFGSTGTFISKQGQVLLAAVLASVAKNAGEAVAAAQQTTMVAAGGLGAAQTATNVTGDQAKYIAGRSVVDGASMIAQWYLDYAKQLVPSIGIGSGQTVHVVMLETIRVPSLQE